jgi:hypothetical protein
MLCNTVLAVVALLLRGADSRLQQHCAACVMSACQQSQLSSGRVPVWTMRTWLCATCDCLLIFPLCWAVHCLLVCAQAVAYLQSQGAVIDLAAQEIDTKATRAVGRGR